MSEMIDLGSCYKTTNGLGDFYKVLVKDVKDEYLVNTDLSFSYKYRNNDLSLTIKDIDSDCEHYKRNRKKTHDNYVYNCLFWLIDDKGIKRPCVIIDEYMCLINGKPNDIKTSVENIIFLTGNVLNQKIGGWSRLIYPTKANYSSEKWQKLIDIYNKYHKTIII